jgi:precorrin-4 methylase
MTLQLILGEVAHQRHPAPSRESLHQAQRKLLTMVLYGSATLVDRAVKKKLLSILL